MECGKNVIVVDWMYEL